MTDTIANRTAELLARPGRAVTLRQRHRDYFETLAAEADANAHGDERREWSTVLDEEYDNLRIALDWSLGQGDVDEALGLAHAVITVGKRRGEFSGRDLVERTLSLAGEETSTRRARLLLSVSLGPSYLPQNKQLDAAKNALEVAVAAGDERLAGDIHRRLCSWIRATEGADVARAHREQALAIGRRLGDDLLVANALQDGWWLDDDRRERERNRGEAKRLFRKVGNREALGWMLYGIDGWVDDPSGQAALDESFEIAREIDDLTLLLCAHELQACRRAWAGDYIGAVSSINDALDELRRGDRRIQWAEHWMLMDLAIWEASMGRVEDAVHHVESCLASTGNAEPIDTAWLEAIRAQVAAHNGDHASAVASATEAVEMARAAGQQMLLSFALFVLGQVSRAAGDLDAARSALVEAAGREDGGADWDTAYVRSRWLLADLLLAEGDVDGADRMLDGTDVELAARVRANAPMTQVHRARIARARDEIAAALALYSAAISTLAEIGHRPYMALVLEDVAALALEEHAYARAATLFGAAERVREDCAFAVPIEERRRYEDRVAALRSVADVAEAWAEGRDLALDNAIALALDKRSGR